MSGPNSFQYLGISGSSGPNSFQYLGISGSSGPNSFQYLGNSGSSGSNSFQYLGNSGSSGQFKSNIDEVLYRFKNEKLDYFDYLKLMGIEDDLGPYIAWSKFKETPNLDAAYMLKFAEALKATPTPTPTKERFIRENLGGTTRVDEIASHYCDIVANQGKKECVCYNSSKVLADQDQRARDDHNNIAIPAWRERNRISKEKHEAAYADYLVRLRLKNEELDALQGQSCEFGQNKYKVDDTSKYYTNYSYTDDSCGRNYWKWYKWYTPEHKERELIKFVAQNEMLTRSWVPEKEPIFTPTNMNNQCCSNSIEVGSGGSVAQNVLQSCNQVIMSAKEQESAEAKKKQDEEDAKKKAEEDKKKAEEDEKKAEEDAIVAAAKKKKMITIIAIIVGVIVVLGLVFAAYKMFFDSESGEAVAETPSANGAETPVSV